MISTFLVSAHEASSFIITKNAVDVRSMNEDVLSRESRLTSLVSVPDASYRPTKVPWPYFGQPLLK
jgi:hypothetical protein